MDAPNAPNSANPNAQGQNVNAELGPANQVQGPVVQNRAQCLAVQNPAQDPADQNQHQVPAGQVPAQGPVQVVLKCTCPTITTTSPYATSPCWHCNARSSDLLSKMDREETRIFR